MRTLRTVFILALLINATALAGLVFWLWSSGRLDRARMHRVYEVLKPTAAQEKEAAAKAEAAQQEQQKAAAEKAHWDNIALGPRSPGESLEAQQQAADLRDQLVQRLQRDKQDLERQMALVQDLLAKERADFDAQRKAFDEARAAELRQSDDRDFQAALQMYEQLKPKQVKEMFQGLLQQNKTAEVVNYLAAMQLRKAAAVLKEFKTPEEVAQATDLLQRLRQRGVDPMPTSAKAPVAGGVGTNPGTNPGANPGMTPGATMGTAPGAAPGAAPGSTPGAGAATNPL
jgi:hypothetical protein